MADKGRHLPLPLVAGGAASIVYFGCLRSTAKAAESQ
jgi:hypothetical protein